MLGEPTFETGPVPAPTSGEMAEAQALFITRPDRGRQKAAEAEQKAKTAVDYTHD